MTVQEALSACGIDTREARLLLAEASGFSDASVLAYPERKLPAQIEQTFFQFVARRKRGEPIAYIVGHKEFYGLDLIVNPAVLIPRPETELLVDLALEREFSSVADLGTGSGALLLALLKELPAASGVGTDISAAALGCARANANALGLAARAGFVACNHGEALRGGPDRALAQLAVADRYKRTALEMLENVMQDGGRVPE